MIIIIRNVSWAANQHIRMISEGSCDSEDWSNDAENSPLHCRNKLYFKIYLNRKLFFLKHNISLFWIEPLFYVYIYLQYHWFYCIVAQIYSILTSIRNFQKLSKNCTDNILKSREKLVLYWFPNMYSTLFCRCCFMHVNKKKIKKSPHRQNWLMGCTVNPLLLRNKQSFLP